MARTGIVYGNSGTYKSTAVKHFARYIYEVTGKATLLFSMDGGGWGPMVPEIEAGIILPYRGNIQSPLPILRKLSQGFWPKDSAATEIVNTNMIPIDWSKFGGIAIEGLTSISQALMSHLADKNIKTGEEATSPFQNRVMVNGVAEVETFAGNSRGHFMFVQKQLYSLVTQLGALPCEYVLFTALESKTEDDDRSTIYGPQVAGKKATNMVPSWVGDCLHSEGLPVERVVQVPDPADASKTIPGRVIDTVVRTYFVKHPDPQTGILFPAKSRVASEKVPELNKRYPGGYFEPSIEHGLDTYLHMIDELNSSQGDAAAKWRDDVDRKYGRGKYAGQATGAAATAAPVAQVAEATKDESVAVAAITNTAAGTR